ncbi:MAG: TAXI family TRAP transporter solute-binding subunit [Rhodospirillales bacterium]|nr:TAXI family TRAP transporter solute-binding subunit [Rhodospirillales bacterium]
MKLSTFCAAAVVAAATAGTAQAQVISISTTAAGSFTNSIGSAIGKVIVEDLKMKAVVAPGQSHGHEQVNDGNSDLSLVTASDLQFFVTGTGDYEGRGARKNIRIVARMVPLIGAAFVQKNSPIKSLTDIKGHRIGWGFHVQKSVFRLVQAQLANAGLGEKDVKPVLVQNIIGAANDFAAGKTDVFWFAVGSGKVKQVSAKVGGLRILPIDGSPAAVARMSDVYPTSYAMMMKPSPAAEGLTKPSPLMAYDMVLFSNTKMSEDRIYKIVKALSRNKKSLASTFRPLARFDPKGMAKPYAHLTYHPGAVKFYKEQGTWPPKG